MAQLSVQSSLCMQYVDIQYFLMQHSNYYVEDFIFKLQLK